MGKKRIYNKIAILLIGIIVMQMSCVPHSFAMVSEPVDNLGIDYVIDQEDALNAYNAIINSLNTGEINEDIYAGAYIDGTKLIIMLTEQTDEIKNEYLSVVENQNAVEFQQAEYSLKYITEQLNDTVDALSNYPITESGFYESRNKGYIKIDSDYYDRFISEIPNFYSECDMPIVFEPGEYSEVSLTIENEPFSNFEDSSKEYSSTNSTRDIMGGIPIETSKGTATIGFCGYYGIMDAIITAGHAVSEGEDTEYGRVIQRQFNNNQNGDYAIIFVDSNYKITNNIDSHIGTGADRLLNVRTVYSNVPEGTSLYAYGNVSEAVSAKVEATNVSRYLYSYGVNIRGLTVANYTGGEATFGDSGGPVVVLLGSYQVAACGIIHGGTNDGKGMYFTPFDKIAAAFSPKTSP